MKLAPKWNAQEGVAGLIEVAAGGVNAAGEFPIRSNARGGASFVTLALHCRRSNHGSSRRAFTSKRCLKGRRVAITGAGFGRQNNSGFPLPYPRSFPC